MALLGQGILAFWNDVAGGGDAEFVHWHSREHIPERVGLRGFRRGRRYVAIAGNPKYFTLYETESLETLSGPDYVARLNAPTPWTQRALPLFRNSKRSACRVTLSLGSGVGGALTTLEFGPQPGCAPQLREWLTAGALPTIADWPGVVGLHLCEADATTTDVRTEEKTLRGRPDAAARWVILVEALEPEAAEAASRELTSAGSFARHGAAEDMTLAIYRLQYCLARQ